MKFHSPKSDFHSFHLPILTPWVDESVVFFEEFNGKSIEITEANGGSTSILGLGIQDPRGVVGLGNGASQVWNHPWCLGFHDPIWLEQQIFFKWVGLGWVETTNFVGSWKIWKYGDSCGNSFATLQHWRVDRNITSRKGGEISSFLRSFFGWCFMNPKNLLAAKQAVIVHGAAMCSLQFHTLPWNHLTLLGVVGLCVVHKCVRRNLLHPGKLTAGLPKNHPIFQSGKSSEPHLHDFGFQLFIKNGVSRFIYWSFFLVMAGPPSSCGLWPNWALTVAALWVFLGRTFRETPIQAGLELGGSSQDSDKWLVIMVIVSPLFLGLFSSKWPFYGLWMEVTNHLRYLRWSSKSW